MAGGLIALVVLWSMFLLSFLIFGLILFGGVVYPIWAIVHCATAERTSGSKAVWIICMILFWPLASLLYGLLASQQKWLRRLSILLIAGMIILGAGLFYGLQFAVKMSQSQIREAAVLIHQLDHRELSKEEFDRFKATFYVLDNQLSQKMHLRSIERWKQVSECMNTFGDIVEDNTLTRAEYEQWMGQCARINQNEIWLNQI